MRGAKISMSNEAQNEDTVCNETGELLHCLL